MEIIIGVAVVFGLLLLLGVDVTTLLNIFQIMLAALTVLCLLFFIFCLVLLIISRKRPAQLLCIEKQQGGDGGGENEKKMLSKFAFYQVDGEKLRNWFPAEALGAKRIYQSRECFVRIVKLGSKKLVFDRHSVVIVIAGLVLMGLCTAGLSVYWLFALNIL